VGQYRQQQSYPLTVPAPGGGTTTVTVIVTFTANFLDPPAGPGITKYKVDIQPCDVVGTDEFQNTLVGPIRDFVESQIGNARDESGVTAAGGVTTPANELSNQLVDQALKCSPLIGENSDVNDLTSSIGQDGQGSAVLSEANGTTITVSFDNFGTQTWSEKITTTGPQGDVQQIETDNRDGSTTITGFDQTGNQTWQLNQAADGSGSLSSSNGTSVDFTSGQLQEFSRASDGSAVITLASNANGQAQEISLNPDGVVTVSLGEAEAFTAPAGTQVTVNDTQGIVATLPEQNGVTETIALGPNGTLTDTIIDTNAQGDPITVTDQPDPSTGTVAFKSVTDNGQTTQVGSADSTDTDSGLQAALGALTGTSPGGSEGGSDVTDPGDHPPNDPQAPFEANHPSPPDPRDPLVLDLAGAGIKLSSVTQSFAHFDFTGSGFATKTGWITQGEGVLVLNAQPNAPITVNQLVGAQSGDGFADLAALDGNHDGVINASDSAFANLSVWVDADDRPSANVGYDRGCSPAVP
jgi:hypothetical protein